MRYPLLLLFLIPVLFTGCATTIKSPMGSSGDLYFVPLQVPVSPEQVIRMQTIPPKVVPTPQVAPPPPAPPPTPPVTPSPPPYSPDY
jgi:hypothetical protein